jgi:ABC-type lipoprotein export system ATPase subunit
VPDLIVRFQGVSKGYRAGRVETPVLREVDLAIEAGEFVAIVGTSGSGKSTMLNVIGGLDRDYAGAVTVAGSDLAKLSDSQLSHLRNEKVGFVFQQFNLLEHLSCLENVAMPSIFARRGALDARERAQRALDRVGIGDRARDLPANLSGGQKQRVAIARAIFNRPPLLLADEPTGNLDSTTGQQIIELFTALNREDGITLLIVTHESRVSSAAHRVIRLEDGRFVDGSPAAVGVMAAEREGVTGISGPRAADGAGGPK